MITGLNHVTLAVSDLARSVGFYSELLGFEIRMRGPRSAYLEAGTLWLALVAEPALGIRGWPGYSHLAFSVGPSELPVFANKLVKAGVQSWQESESGGSFYFLDPDGYKLELHSGDLKSRLVQRASL